MLPFRAHKNPQSSYEKLLLDSQWVDNISRMYQCDSEFWLTEVVETYLCGACSEQANTLATWFSSLTLSTQN